MVMHNCTECDYHTTSATNLKAHLRRHTVERPFESKHTCPHCMHKAWSKSALELHLRIHTGEKPFQCPHCVYRARSKSNLVSHLWQHTDERPFQCPHCVFQARDESTLKRHHRQHTGEKPFQCPHCVYTARYRSDLTVHLRKHTGEQPFQCPHCVYTSRSKSELTSHLRKHTVEKPFQCPHCVYTSRYKCDLVKHLRKHTGEKPFQCPHCVFRARVASTLKRHLRTHTGEKPFQCPHCEFKAGRKRGLQEHVRRHTANHHTAVQSKGTGSMAAMASVAQPVFEETQQPSSGGSQGGEQTELRVAHRTFKSRSREKAPRRQSKPKVGKVAAVVNVKAEYAPECTRTDGVAAPIPEVDLEVTYIGEMAIYSASVRSPQANAGVLATVVLMSDPDDLSSAAEPSVNVDDAADDGPTDAVVRGTNKARAQPLSPASPEVCFLSTATPTNCVVPPDSAVHSSPHSDDDSDPGYVGDDHQPAQSPAAGGAATLESSLGTELPPFTVPSPTTSRAPTAESWVAEVVPVIEIRSSEQTPQVDSRHRAEAATRAILKKHRTKKKKKREKEKRRRKTSAVVNPNARHPCGGAGLIRVTTPGPELDSEVGGRMSIHSKVSATPQCRRPRHQQE